MHDALRLFALLSPSTVTWLLSIAVERTISENEAISTDGEEIGGLYIVLNGLFTLHVGGAQRPSLAVIGPGELIGEIAFLDSRVATATVVASEASQVLFLSNTQVEHHLTMDSMVAADFYRGLAKVLSHRLRSRSLALADSVSVESKDLCGIPGWTAIESALSRFKEALRRADDAAGHSAQPIPPQCVAYVESTFQELTKQISALSGMKHNASYATEIEAALNRELVAYIHLTQFTRRMLVKPRGYAGDFLTIDYIYGNVPGGILPLGPLIDRLFLEAPTCRAVRNRRDLLAIEILRDVAERGSLQVTSLACGPAAELFDTFAANPQAQIQATLIDVDFQALALVSERRDAADLTKKMRLEHANLVHLATGRRTLDLKNQDLMYSIGLIDYFEDRFVIALLNWIHTCLKDGGRVILGNFHDSNPYRPMMDIVLDWKLIHRSESDMNRLFESSSFDAGCTDIRFENEGINMFAFGVKRAR